MLDVSVETGIPSAAATSAGVAPELSIAFARAVMTEVITVF